MKKSKTFYHNYENGFEWVYEYANEENLRRKKFFDLLRVALIHVHYQISTFDLIIQVSSRDQLD